jgi:uncharacterized protein (DUF1800 family)
MEATIALNRFGLGARPEQAELRDPKRWLHDQLRGFEARPAAIAAVGPTRAIAADLAAYLQSVRDYRREARISRRENPPGRRPGGFTAPKMSDEAMTGDAAAMQDMRGDAMQETAPPADAARDPVNEARRFARRQAREYYVGQVGARAQAALVTPSPFIERLVHFWANHFAVSIDKFIVVGLCGQLEFEAIRPHVLGKFGDMLHAVERHPAMLLYLDQAASVGPNSMAAQLRARRRQQASDIGLNENLAREILELHTLGVRTGYSQADVTELARAMTGWTVAGLAQGTAARFAGIEGEPGSFAFAERLHEPGPRTILGRQWNGRGEAQAAEVLDHLATHPATARHIATKLARHFAGDDPPASLVGRLEASFLKSGGDLPTLYRVLIDSPECWVPQPLKFKNPWEWSLSALRAVGTPQVQPNAVIGLLRQLGQPVWQPGSPAGWDDLTASWAGPDAIMRRVEAAERIASRTNDAIDARARAAQIFPGGGLSAGTAQAIARAESPGQGLALMLVSPEMMRR